MVDSSWSTTSSPSAAVAAAGGRRLPLVESEDVRQGAILDYDEQDRVVGAEFLNISSRTKAEELTSIQFQSA